MADKPKYQTTQSFLIVEYLEGRKGQHLTAKAIVAGLEETGAGIGAATVYRQLERLGEEGLMRKYFIGEGEAACFEYVGEDCGCANDHCFHCLCTSCGRLVHVECHDLGEVGDHLLSHHGFAIDPLRTVFYGLCADCRG